MYNPDTASSPTFNQYAHDVALREQGVAALINMGISPGITNFLIGDQICRISSEHRKELEIESIDLYLREDIDADAVIFSWAPRSSAGQRCATCGPSRAAIGTWSLARIWPACCPDQGSTRCSVISLPGISISSQAPVTRRAWRAGRRINLDRLGHGVGRRRWLPWSTPFLNPHSHSYRKSNPVTALRQSRRRTACRQPRR